MCGVSLGVVRHAWERVGVVGQDISVQCGFLGSGLWVVVRFFVQMGVHSIKFRDHHLRASERTAPCSYNTTSFMPPRELEV